MATKQSKSRALVDFDAELAALAEQQATAFKSASIMKSLRINRGNLMIDEVPVESNELAMIIIGAIYENQYYEAEYDANNPTPPSCYAFAQTEEELTPHDEATSKQGDANGLCAGCWANEMGSAERGKGKACKNVRRLAVILADDLEDIENAEVRTLKVPVMSTRNFDNHAHAVAKDYQRPLWAVVTQLQVVDDDKSQFKLLFKVADTVQFTSEQFAAMKAKVQQVEPQLFTAYPALKEESEKSARRPKHPVVNKPVKGPVSRKPAPPAPAAKPKFARQR